MQAKLTVAALSTALVLITLTYSPLDGTGAVVQPVAAIAPPATTTEATSTTVPVTTTPPATTTSTSAPAPTTATSVPTTSTTVPPASPAPLSGLDLLRQLAINDAAPPAGYSRDLFPTWLDIEHNGCDARQDTLTIESEIPVQRSGCDVVSGRWTSIYDGIVVTVPGDLDVDHMVPLAEAWRSGADEWHPGRRAQYANDLSYPDHLIAVTAGSNRSKSDQRPDEWRPPQQQSWCRYATAWTTVKITWSLTITTSERDALGEMLDQC